MKSAGAGVRTRAITFNTSPMIDSMEIFVPGGSRFSSDFVSGSNVEPKT